MAIYGLIGNYNVENCKMQLEVKVWLARGWEEAHECWLNDIFVS